MQRRYAETSSDAVRAELQEYMVQALCGTCGGRRLKPESLAVTVHGKNIGELVELSVVEARVFFDDVPLREKGRPGLEPDIAGPILKEVRDRLRFLVDVGLDYLTLGRSAESLSGGEAQRIRLATQIGSRLVGVLYILDEPSIGLHQRDNARLLAHALPAARPRQHRDRGRARRGDDARRRPRDRPRARRRPHGGQVIAEGTVDEIERNADVAHRSLPQRRAAHRRAGRRGAPCARATRCAWRTRASTTCGT